MLRLASLVVLASLAATAAAQPEPAPVAPVPAPLPPEPPLPAEPPLPPEPPPPPEPEKKKDKKPKVQISGYIQGFFRAKVDVNDDGRDPHLFRILRARLQISGKIAPKVRFVVEIDPRAPEVSGLMRDAYLQFAVIPNHRIRIGQQKTPFGHENRLSSSRLYFVNRAEVSDNISRGPNLRDIGIGLVGGWPISDKLALEDAIAVVNGAGMNVQADNTKRKNVYGRVGVRYAALADLAVTLGVSGAWGDQEEPTDFSVDPPEDGFTFLFKRFGADLEVEHRWGFLAAEYVMGLNEVLVGLPDAIEDETGYYVYAGARTPWHVGPLARFDALDDYQRITIGGYWGEPDAALRALVNYEISSEEDIKNDHRLYLWLQGRF